MTNIPKMCVFCFFFAGNGRIVFDLKTTGGYDALYPPLGLDMDENGLLYAAIYSGSVLVIDPRYYSKEFDGNI